MQNYWQKEIETASRDQITAWQNERLCNTVEHVYKNVELYRRRMDEAGVKPGRHKDDRGHHEAPVYLQAGSARHISLRNVRGTHVRSRAPSRFLRHDRQADRRRIYKGRPRNMGDICARQLVAAGATKEDKIHISYGYGLFTGGLGLHGGAQRLGATAIPVSSGNTARQITILQDFGSDFLCCTPSYAMYIAETMENEGIDTSRLPLRGGIFGAEPWTEEMRREIERKLNIKAYDIYGLTETMGPGVAYECSEQHGMHVNEDHFIIEIINPETGEHMPDGEQGEIVFSCITKKAFPLLRYRTRDIGVITHEKCSCGRTFVRMSKPMGRTDDMLIIRGVNVFPSQIETVLLNMGYSPNYQIVVDRVNNLDTIEVLVEMTEEAFSDVLTELSTKERALSENIKSLLGVAAKVRLVSPKSIKRSEGKAVRVIDNRKK